VNLTTVMESQGDLSFASWSPNLFHRTQFDWEVKPSVQKSGWAGALARPRAVALSYKAPIGGTP
jgi:hypothetical protein